jgi:hypothetical protein
MGRERGILRRLRINGLVRFDRELNGSSHREKIKEQ